MIVNSRMENHNNLQQQIQINSSNDCENFYLKRKYDSLILDTINDNNNDIIDNDEQSSSTLVYIQPKKRHLLNFTSINNDVDDTTITNESVYVTATIETTTKSLSSLATGTIATTVFNDNHENDHHHHHQHPCEITTTYNLNNELDNSFTNHCQNIADFLNYENTLITSTSPPSVSPASQSQSLQSSLSSSSSSIINHIQNPIYITSSSINDTTNWQNSDLLELDHRYNSINISNLNDNQIIQLDNNKSPSPRQQHQHQHKQQQQQQQQQHQEQHQQQITMNTTTSQTDSDFEDKNLSWLFNFKLDELPNLSPSEVNRCSVSINNHSNNCNNKLSTVLSSSSSSSSTTLLAANQLSSSSITVPGTITTLSSPSSLEAINTNRNQSSKTATGRKVDELILEVTSSECYENDIAVGENVIVENNTTRTPKKPPFTYTELIEYALEDKRELTVSGIYQWISDRFPFYKSNDDRWKNSVRHNLSINPHFRKGIKAPQGAGHLWTISSRDSEENTLAWEHKKQRLELFFRMENSSQQKLNNHNNNNNNNINNNNGSNNNNTANSIIENQSESNNSAIYDEAATAAANIVQQLRNEENSSVSSPKLEQQQQQQQHHNLSSQTLSITTTNSITNNHDHNDHNDHHHHSHHHHESSTTAEQILTEISDEDLQKAAGEILNGVRRNVEVQSLETLHSSDISTYHDNLLHTGIGGDYLNPINKYDAVAESGLRHRSLDIANEFYVTEIDPIELGINMSNVEEEVLFSDEFNLNYFGINPNSDIVA